MNTAPHPEQEATVRLAECDAVAVDMCPCGTIHLHVGALSLRLRPDGAASLLQALGLAFARRQAMLARATDAGELFASPYGTTAQPKGEA
jgi:hypothetical protein